MAQTRKIGMILLIVSATVFAFAGIFTRGVSTGPWEIIFWRGLGAAGLTLIWLHMRGRLVPELALISYPFILVVLLNAAGTSAFIPAFKISGVANVAVIFSLAPLIAAGLAWILLREKPDKITITASLVALTGVTIIFSGSLTSGSFIGDLLALFMTLMMASLMVCYRRWSYLPSALPSALSSLVLVPVAFFLGAPGATPLGEIGVLIIGFGICFAIASITMMEGAKRLPTAEAALLSSLETPLAPILALIILSESPSIRTIIGGSIIFAAVVWSQIKLKN